MSISAYKVFVDNDVLPAADLNLSFAQIISNPIDLWSPAAKAASMGGFALHFNVAATQSLVSTVNGLSVSSALNFTEAATVASAATVNLSTIVGNQTHITGSTTVTAVTLAEGCWRLVIFDGAPLLTHSSSLVLPGSANIQTVAGDRGLFFASGIATHFLYFPIAGVPLAGTYTPTLTNGVNAAGSTAQVTSWFRVRGGSTDIVHVFGSLNIDPTASATGTQVGISLPVASNLAQSYQLAGTCMNTSITGGNAGGIFGNATDNRAELFTTPVDTSDRTYTFHFSYLVL